LNVSDSPYQDADWESRSTLVDHLREISSAVKRLVDLGDLSGGLSVIEINRLGGIAGALNFSAETFDRVNLPIREVRERIDKKKDEMESILLGFRKTDKVMPETEYLNTAINVLEKILEITEGLETEEAGRPYY
jgi:hypothetical protein